MHDFAVLGMYIELLLCNYIHVYIHVQPVHVSSTLFHISQVSSNLLPDRHIWLRRGMRSVSAKRVVCGALMNGHIQGSTACFAASMRETFASAAALDVTGTSFETSIKCDFISSHFERLVFFYNFQEYIDWIN